MSGVSKTRARSAQTRARPAAAGRIRIIGGKWRGRYIDVPKGAAVRPTPNRVRETVFNWLQSEIAGARCLDLFAGTGALGLEALSRGAAQVTFTEVDSQLVASLQAQLSRLGSDASVVPARGEDYIARTREEFDVIFLDPPFDLDAEPICSACGDLLRARGALYCERDANDELPDLAWGHWVRTARAGGVRFGLARRD